MTIISVHHSTWPTLVNLVSLVSSSTDDDDDPALLSCLWSLVSGLMPASVASYNANFIWFSALNRVAWQQPTFIPH